MRDENRWGQEKGVGQTRDEWVNDLKNAKGLIYPKIYEEGLKDNAY